MKLMTKVKAIIILAVIALIGAVCTACGAPGKQLAEFKFSADTPTEMLYTNEIYFRDYIPREYGNEYKLYASYVYEDESGETITVENELQDSMVFTFEHVTDYSFKIVRNGNEADAITRTIKCMPEAPKFIRNGGATIAVGREYSVNRMAFYAFGAEELVNAKMASVDPLYKCELINIDLVSAEVFGEDVRGVSFNPNGKFKFDKEGFYELTFKASNRAGEEIKTVTMTTANTTYHNPTRTGYLLPAGADGNEFNQVIFEAPDSMLVPEDGAQIDVRFGGTEDGKIYKATYSSYFNNYTIDNFDMELNPDASKVGERLYIKEATIGEGDNAKGGGSFSTMITTPVVVNQSNAQRMCVVDENYVILTSDIDFADIPLTHTDEPVFMGVFDGRGYTISNTQNGYVNGVKQGSFLFAKCKGGVVKNFMLKNAHGCGGALFGRVEGALVAKNIVCEITGEQGYSGGRVAFLGVVAETAAYVTVKDCVVSMFPSTSVYQGLVSDHAGAKTIISGFYGIGGTGTLHSTAGNSEAYPASFLNTKKLAAQEGVDYWLGTDAEVLYNQYQAGNLTEFLNDKVKELGMYVELTKENITTLQSATGGYFILTEDIDMTGIQYKTTQTSAAPFRGTLNGNGHKIYNFDQSGVPAVMDGDTVVTPAIPATAGLIGFGSGATVKNLYLDIVKTGDRGGLFGQSVGNGITVTNVAVNVREVGMRGTSIVSVVQAPVTLTNVIANVKKAVGTGSNPSGIGEGLLTTLEAGTKGVTINNVLMVSEDGKLATPVPARKDYAAMGMYNTAGEHAEYYTDYRVERGILDYDRETLPNDMLKDFYDEILKDFDYTEITNDNKDVLKTMTQGYFLLKEDIDLSGSKWKGTQTETSPFTGTLNGNGHTISGINSGVSFTSRDNGYYFIPFAGQGATIKNVSMEFAKLPKVSATMFATVNGDTVIENSVITLAVSDKTGINTLANNVNAKLTVKDSIVATLSGTTAVNNSLVNTGTGSIVLNNTFVVDGSGCENLSGLTPKTLAGNDAEIAKDYKFVTDIFDLVPAQLTTEYLAETYADIIDGFEFTTITNENVDTLLTATTGYFVLGEDIDLSEKEWAPTATFTGTLNGKQFNIVGLDTALFNALGDGAVVRTVGIKASGIGNGDAAIAKNVSGAAKLENVGIYVASMPSNNSGVITANNASELTLKEVFVVLEGANTANTSGVLAAGSGTVNYDGTYVVTTMEDLYKGTATGTANAFWSIDEFMTANSSGDIYLNEALFAAVNNLKVIKAISNENVADLFAAVEGYWYLTEDIDLTGVTYTPAQAFFGTFDGEGYAITGVTSKLFNEFSGTIRNVGIKTKDVAAGTAIIADKLSAATVYNVTIDSANSTTIANVASVDVALNNVIITSNVIVKPFATIESGAEVIAQNVIAISAEGANLEGFLAVDGTTEATEGVDFFSYEVIDELMGAYSKEEVALSDMLIEGLDDLGVANYLTQSNITDLLGDNEGYWYLIEDVDIGDIDWNGGELNGTLDGLGHTIMNFNCDPATSFAGFFSNCEADTSIVIKNLKLNISSFKGTNRGALFGQMRGGTALIENVVIDVNYFSAHGAGILTHHGNDSDVTMKDVTINIDGGSLNTKQGLLVAYTTSSNLTVVMDNLVVICGVEAINENFCYETVTLLGKDGETAVAGEDYMLFVGAEAYATAVVDEEYAPTQFATDALTELGVVIALNQENIMLLDDARGGYWYLTEDIDMTGITFDTTIAAVNNDKLAFSGVFNGAGYTINNFTPNTALQFSGLFGRVHNGAVFKNFTLNFDKLGHASGLMGLTYSGGDVYVQNVVITVDSAQGNGNTHRTPICAVVQANLHLEDVLVVYLEENPSIYSGLAVNAVSTSHPIVVSGVHVVAPGTYTVKVGSESVQKPNKDRDLFGVSGAQGGDNNTLKELKPTKVLAEKGVDYFTYSSLADIARDNLGTDFLKAQYDALTAPSGADA